MLDLTPIIPNPPLTQAGSSVSSPDAGVLTTRYGFDEQGNKISQIDAEGRETRWEYDQMGRETARILPLGQRETFSYNAAGERTGHVDFAGASHTMAYDTLGRPISQLYADGRSVSTSYTATGQVAQIIDSAEGTTGYEYDERDRLTRVSYHDGTYIEYQYDAAGNRTQLTTPARTVDYTFDVLNRLETVTDETGTTSYGYDLVGNRATMSYPNGTVTEYSYDGRHRLTQLTHRRLGAVLLGLSYLLNPDGTRAAIIEDSGGVITRSTEYAYDAVKRLTSETVRDGIGATQRQTSWIFDKVGNRLEQTVTDNTAVVGASLLAITDYQYDLNDRLSTETTDTSIDGAASGSDTTSYTYDAKGNTLTKVRGGQTLAQYQWDSAGRLRQAITPDPENPGSDTTTRYTYLADGIRRSQTERFGEAGAQTTRYLIDPVQAYAQVLEERVSAAGAGGAGVLTAAYTYGDDLISLRRPVDGAGGLGSAEARWYHVDGLGSTRLLSDASGSVTDRYTYTAYGELDQAASQVASENSYLYTGEQFDAGLGFYYLRARYYEAGSGRFASMDTWAGDISDPITLSKYLYGNASPGIFVDPSGNVSALSEFGVAARAVGQLSLRVASGARAFSRTFVGAGRIGLAAIRSEIRRCVRSRGRKCRILVPIIVAGTDLPNQMQHIADAQLGRGENFGRRWITPVLNYQQGAINRRSWPVRSFPSGFSFSTGTPLGLPACQPKDKAKAVRAFGPLVDCDEYPFNASKEGGYANYKRGRVSARFIPKGVNIAFGLIIAAATSGLKNGDNYIVVPADYSPSSFPIRAK